MIVERPEGCPYTGRGQWIILAGQASIGKESPIMKHASMRPSATRAGAAPRGTGTAAVGGRTGVMGNEGRGTVPAALQGTHP